MRLDAPAKLNLTLSVVGRREDGYHLLDSHVVLLDLADHLLLLPGCSGLRVEGEDGSGLPLDDRNLAWRGLVAGLGDEPDLACLALDKAIPVASGLGGGSSDAAAARRLGRAWRGLPEGAADEGDLEGLARIGADVPFFAACVAAARVTGIGEVVETLRPERRACRAGAPAVRAVHGGRLRRAQAGRVGERRQRPARAGAAPPPGAGRPVRARRQCGGRASPDRIGAHRVHAHQRPRAGGRHRAAHQ